MAYDFGTNTLGIQNPFRPEGAAKAVTGVILCAMGAIQLLSVGDNLEVDLVKGWLHAGLGFVLLVWGMRLVAQGLYQLFRFFVGRSVPTSLAQNHNASEAENAELEKDSLPYNAKDLESMLMGRKNSTFSEPRGWIARLLHSIFPKLLFLPYPMRNFVQELGGLVATSVVALTAFGIAYFVSESGLAGAVAGMITPIFSILLLLYLTVVWWSSSSSLKATENQALATKNASGLAKVLGISIVLPVLIGFGYSRLDPAQALELREAIGQILVFDAWYNLVILLVVSLVVIASAWVMVRERFSLTQPTTEVSEFRENLQESVHPNEIFINIENIVLANRRYKEIPNRIYRDFDPVLQEQSQGKGSFKGQLLIETQPEFLPVNYSSTFRLFRLLSTVVAQVMYVIAAALLVSLVGSAYDLYSSSAVMISEAPSSDSFLQILLTSVSSGLGVTISNTVELSFAFLTLLIGARILSRGTFLFWSEMQFSSLLMWMKTEGTFTESKISTGMSIHDSTRSENVVVRSSITPWLITSRVVTSTFALSGINNLEMPRLIMTMSSNANENIRIVDEIKAFLRDREAIASITNEGDLGNAETIYRVNEASRAQVYGVDVDDQKELDQQASGKLLRDQAADDQAG